MRFYVISDSTKPTGVILHDYSTGYFSVHTHKRSLQLCIDAAVRYYKGSHLVRSGDHVLKIANFSPNNVAWVSTILGKVLGESCKVTQEGSLKVTDSIEEFVKGKLSY